VDTNALDFMAQYNLTLAGDVQRELSDGIKRVIMQGIVQGKGTDDIVRDLGHVVIYKDSFRQAGTRVFSKAQYRMEMIARTEVLRAHNMGRIKFHQQVGIEKLEWMTMDDERTCPVCGPLDGKKYSIDKFPQQPAHPLCRCCVLPIIGPDHLKKI
jgi:SPP1 gp7 family putative phage head morphogenesis protein